MQDDHICGENTVGASRTCQFIFTCKQMDFAQFHNYKKNKAANQREHFKAFSTFFFFGSQLLQQEIQQQFIKHTG